MLLEVDQSLKISPSLMLSESGLSTTNHREEVFNRNPHMGSQKEPIVLELVGLPKFIPPQVGESIKKTTGVKKL